MEIASAAAPQGARGFQPKSFPMPPVMPPRMGTLPTGFWEAVFLKGVGVRDRGFTYGQPPPLKKRKKKKHKCSVIVIPELHELG